MLTKIISGGQTGADQGGLEAAGQVEELAELLYNIANTEANMYWAHWKFRSEVRKGEYREYAEQLLRILGLTRRGGNRESKAPGIQKLVREFLVKALKGLV